VALHAWYQGRKEARVFAIGQTISAVVLGATALTMFGVLPFDQFSLESGGVAIGLHALVLCLTLADRVRLLQVAKGTAERWALENLEGRGYTVVIVGDGQQAVHAVETGAFDAILMDIQMPVMDGFEATRAIREREPAGQRAAIVALTAHAMKGDRERCLNAGMDGYVSKPLEIENLMATLARLLGNDRSGQASIGWPGAMSSGAP
jgi:CheY-like chemotaxis protein